MENVSKSNFENERIRKRWALIVLSVIAAFAIFYRLQTRQRNSRNSPDVVAYFGIAKVGNAILRYSYANHGDLPDKLSQLMPNYLAYSNIDLLCASSKNRVGDSDVLSGEKIERRIEIDGRFVYLGKQGLDKDIVLYERSKYWPKDVRQWTVLTLTSNLTARLRSVEDIGARIP